MTTNVQPLIPLTASIRDALENLTLTGVGLVCVGDERQRVVGVASDGDLRKRLLSGGQMGDSIVDTMNREFVSLREGASREQVLKLLDTRIRVAPILNGEGAFVSMATRSYVAPGVSAYARAKAPVRISLAGGGTDITRHFIKRDSVCLSATMACYSHVTLKQRSDGVVKFISQDLHQTVEVKDLASVEYDGKLDLLKAGARIMKPEYGFEMVTACDFPPGSGLGGSATLLASIIACFNEFSGAKLGPYEIAEHMFEAERIELNIAGGWQDQYATVFGGMNFLQFKFDRNIVIPLRVPNATLYELEERLLICHTGQQHLGSVVHEKLREQSASADYQKFSDAIADIAHKMRDDLLRGHLEDFGKLLHETWVLKRAHSPGATSDRLDEIYELALRNGAQGGRLLGTGGGGFFIFAVEPFRWYELADALRSNGLKVDSVILDTEGLRSWTYTT
jgi:D-glycero-alpha-D-manno-heptose-7-phosphate kinase